MRHSSVIRISSFAISPAPIILTHRNCWVPRAACLPVQSHGQTSCPWHPTRHPMCVRLLFDPPAGQPDDPVGLVGDCPIVRNHHYSEVPLAVQGSQNADDVLAGGLVEVAGRLVGQQQVGWATSARAMAARCISPPIARAGGASAGGSDRPSPAIPRPWPDARRRCRRKLHAPCAIISGMSTFSSVVNSGSKW